MKAEIELKNTLYNKACREAERQNCTVDEWMAAAIERQLKQTESLRHFVAEKSKGASQKKALGVLRKLAVINADAPVTPGDEMTA